ncbi:MAG: hypothetical protein JNM43_16530, partial [Planctomycetaceae bacterium]|nr:hypothetical protein [Planctomycetaceae bacterium]
QVVAHYRKAQDFDPEHTGQELEPLANPLFAMRKVSSSSSVFAAEVRPADAAADSMEDLNFPVGDDLFAIQAWHGAAPVVVIEVKNEQ